MYKRYGQPNDLLGQLNVAGMIVMDVPIELVYDVGEKLGIKQGAQSCFHYWLLIGTAFLLVTSRSIHHPQFPSACIFHSFGLFGVRLSALLFIRLFILRFTQEDIPEIIFLS